MEALLKKINEIYKKNNFGDVNTNLELSIYNNKYYAHYYGIEASGDTIEEAIEQLEFEIDEYRKDDE